MKTNPYNLYLDDTGTKEYAQSYTGGVTPYFGFGGMLVTPAIAGYLDSECKRLKASTFGTPDVEIKANWLRRDEEREKRYRKVYGVSDDDLTKLTNELYDLINRADCMLFGSIINKQEVQTTYPNPFYAPAIAYDCMLQRVQKQMEAFDGEVHVTIDDMSGATPKGNQYKRNLKNQHAKLRTFGSMLQKRAKYDRIGGQSFANSKHDERLQLSDLIAYATYRQFVDHGARWDGGDSGLPLYEYFQRIVRKFSCDPNGVITGWGVVKFPRLSQNRWGIRKNP